MQLLQRVPSRYLWLVPAIYFAALGAFDIGSDLLHHHLSTASLIFNLLLFVPLIVRYPAVHAVFGWLTMFVSSYFFFALLYFFSKYLEGTHFHHSFQMFVIGPLFVSSLFLSALSFVYSGNRRMSRVNAALQR